MSIHLTNSFNATAQHGRSFMIETSEEKKKKRETTFFTLSPLVSISAALAMKFRTLPFHAFVYSKAYDWFD